MRILVVEDEVKMAELLGRGLRKEGMAVDVASRGEDAIWMAEANPYDVIILDVMLPGMDGFAVCERVRAADPRVPILILTARSDEGDRITGLKSGADDYLAKPFSLSEFLLRVGGMLRRSAWYRPEPVEEAYRFGENEVFLLSYHARTAQGEIDLTELEVKMLSLFFQREGEAIPRREILESVWGYTSDTETRTLDNFIVRLRKYFEPNPAKPVFFQTVRGVGYRFARKPASSEVAGE
jgi:DNA-binding response OmpR family regulator